MGQYAAIRCNAHSIHTMKECQSNMMSISKAHEMENYIICTPQPQWSMMLKTSISSYIHCVSKMTCTRIFMGGFTGLILRDR